MHGLLFEMVARREDRVWLVEVAEELLAMGEVRGALRLASAVRAAGLCASAAQRRRVRLILRAGAVGASRH